MSILKTYSVLQSRVRDEINAALKQNDGKVTMSYLQNLPFLERVLKESLRLYPSVPAISRETAEETQLSNYLNHDELHKYTLYITQRSLKLIAKFSNDFIYVNYNYY